MKEIGLTPNKMYSTSINCMGDSSPSFSIIKKWNAEFKCGCTNMENATHNLIICPCEGHPKTAATPETIEEVHNMLLDDY